MSTQNPTPVTPFTPAANDVPSGMPEGVSYGTRTIYGLRESGDKQFLVFKPGFNAENDTSLNHVLASGFTLSHACQMAIRMTAYLAIPPEHYWKRLAGCRFDKVVEPGKGVVQQLCLAPDGRELGRADFREEAARNALHRVLVDAQDVSFAEFSVIAVPVEIELSGRRTYGAVYAGGYGDGAVSVDAMLVRMYHANPSVRQAARTIFEQTQKKAAGDAVLGWKTDPFARSRGQDPAYMAFKSLCHREVLSTAGRAQDADVHIFGLGPADESWKAYIVLHTRHLSPDVAMKVAYDQFLAERQGEDISQPETQSQHC